MVRFLISLPSSDCIRNKCLTHYIKAHFYHPKYYPSHSPRPTTTGMEMRRNAENIQTHHNIVQCARMYGYLSPQPHRLPRDKFLTHHHVSWPLSSPGFCCCFNWTRYILHTYIVIYTFIDVSSHRDIFYLDVILLRDIQGGAERFTLRFFQIFRLFAKILS